MRQCTSEPGWGFRHIVTLEGDRAAVEKAIRKLTVDDGKTSHVIDLSKVCCVPDSLLRAYDALGKWDYPCYVNAFAYDAEDMEMFYHYLDTHNLGIPEELFHYDKAHPDEHGEWGRVFPQGKQALQVWLLLHCNDLIQLGELAGDAAVECGTSDLLEWCRENWGASSPYIGTMKDGWNGDSYRLFLAVLPDPLRDEVFCNMSAVMPGVRITVRLLPRNPKEANKPIVTNRVTRTAVFENGKLISDSGAGQA